MQKQYIKLTEQDRISLEYLVQNRSLSVKIQQRIQVLLALDSGNSYKAVGHQVNMTYVSIRKICNKYIDGIDVMSLLSDKARSGRPIYWYFWRRASKNYSISL